MDKVCRNCVGFPQVTSRGHGLPPRPVITDVSVGAAPSETVATCRLLARGPKTRVRFLGLPQKGLTCRVDTGADRTHMPRNLLECLGARIWIQKPEEDVTVTYYDPREGQLRCEPPQKTCQGLVEISVPNVPTFELEVEVFDDPSIPPVLGRDALRHFPLLLVPRPGPPMTYIPEQVV